jgi:GcrA cell cycle regulator
MVWDDETIRNLRDLWSQGLSTAEIGRRLGVSKNAIVGKAHRLDLDGRPSPIRRESSKPQSDRPANQRAAGPTLPPLASTTLTPVPLPAEVPPVMATVVPLRPVLAPAEPRPVLAVVPAPMPQVMAAPLAAPRSASIAAMSRRSAPSCCWPIGEPGTKTFRFCDDQSLPGKPYCDEHARLAYVKIKDRKEDAA